MKIEEVLKRLAPLLPDQVKRWRNALPHLSSKNAALLERHIQAVGRKTLASASNRLLLPPPSRRNAEGELRLGKVLYTEELYPFGIDPEDLLAGLGIYGRSGSGKTNITFSLLLELSRRRIPFLFLDHKRTARHLLPLFKERVAVHTPGRSLSPFPFNPLIPPPGTEVRSHVHQLIDILSAAYTVGDGAKNLLQKTLLASYGATQDWPSLEEVLGQLEALDCSGRASGWKATAQRALESLLLADESHAAQPGQEDLVRRFFEGSTILELDGLGANAKKFLIPTLMMWLFGYRLQARDREQLRLVIIIEEAHHLLYRQENRATESILNQMLRQCRELGIGIVVVDQHPHLISSAALGNESTSIFLNMKEASDVNRASSMAQLADSEKEYLSQLPVGTGIVKLQEGFTNPFLVRFDSVSVDKGLVTDASLRRHLHSNQAHSAWPTGQKASTSRVRGLRPTDLCVSELAMGLLLDCFQHPTDGVKARYERLGLSMDKGGRLKAQLLDADLAEAGTVPIGSSRRLILRPTHHARKFLRPGQSATRESLSHEFWKHYYAEVFMKAGYKVEIEAARKGGRVDVLAQKGAKSLGIEIETGNSNAVQNVRNCLRSRFDQVLVICTSKLAREKIESDLAKDGLFIRDRVRVALQRGQGLLVSTE